MLVLDAEQLQAYILERAQALDKETESTVDHDALLQARGAVLELQRLNRLLPEWVFNTESGR